MTTIAAALAAARQLIPANEARILLRHLLGCSTAYLEAHRDEAIDVSVASEFHALVKRRCCGEPIAYLTHSREFYGRDFYVAPGVLIPRPETELIIDIVLREYRDCDASNTALGVLDLGTGSGCLAVTLALELPHSNVTALDVAPDTLAIAARNVAKHGAHIRLIASDWFAAVAGERFDLIVANPPYIATGAPHLMQGDLRFEPAGALASGIDGLDAIRLILAHVPTHLSAGGRLLIEHGYDQADKVRELLVKLNYQDIEQHRDLAGIIRVSGGRGPALRVA